MSATVWQLPAVDERKESRLVEPVPIERPRVVKLDVGDAATESEVVVLGRRRSLTSS